MTPVSAERHRESLAHLRRLSAELRTFRSRDVQEALERTPLEGADADLDADNVQSSDAVLKAKVFSMKAELADVRKQLEEARSTLSSSVVKEESMRQDFEGRIRKLELDNHEKVGKCKNLERLCARMEKDKERLEIDVREKDSYLRESASREQRLLDDLRASMDKQVSEARKQAEQGAIYKSESEDLIQAREMEQKIIEKEKQLYEAKSLSLEAELEEERNARKSVEQELANLNFEKIDTEQELRSRISKLLANKSGLVEDLESLRSERTSLSEAVRRLKNEAIGSDTSKAELESLRDTISKLRRDAKQGSEAKFMVEALTAEKAKVSELIASLSRDKDLAAGYEILCSAAENPSSAPAVLNASSSHLLHQRAKAHRQEMATLNAKVSNLKSQLASLRRENTSHTRNVARLITNLNSRESEIARIKNLLTIVEVERSGLHTILQTIQGSLRRDSTANSQDDSVKKQLALATVSVNKYKDASRRASDALTKRDEEVVSLKARLSAVTESEAPDIDGEQTAGLRSRLVEAVKAAAEEKSEREKAEEKLRALGREMSNLAEELEQLGRVKQGVKVLHVKDNPYTEARLAHSQGVGQKRRRVDGEYDSGVDESLQQRISELEKKEKLADRYKAIAKRKIEELRIACYSIFGWDIRVHGANYTVASMYAEKEQEKLVFTDNGRGVMSLIENEYCQAIKPKIDQYLGQCHSIPALLAEITFENFEKTTLMP